MYKALKNNNKETVKNSVYSCNNVILKMVGKAVATNDSDIIFLYKTN